MEVYRVRLSLMMFGQYLILGTWIVTLATYLMASPLKGGLNFPPGYAGWIYSTLAIAGIVSPFFVGLLADRLFSAEKLMAGLHLVGALLIAWAAVWCAERHPLVEETYLRLAAAESVEGVPLLEAERFTNRPDLKPAVREAQQRINQHAEMGQLVRDTFRPLFLVMLAYSFTNLLTLTISNVIAMRNLDDPKRNFSSVRLWGTVGWIVAGLGVQLGFQPISPTPLYLAAGLSVVMGLFCLTLPKTPPLGHGKTLGEAIGLPALRLFRQRSFLVLTLCAFVVAISQQFWTIYANRYLNDLGTPAPAATQTLAQVAEVICMASFALVVPKFGLKRLMVFGLFVLALRNGLFATDTMWVVVLLGLPLHGVSYAYFYVTVAIYIDQKAPDDLRGSAQGIFTFISMGSGTFLGNLLSGAVVEAHTLGSDVDWSDVWVVPAAMCLGVAVVFMSLFSDDSHPHRK
jgi:nucleoside transporter